MGKRGTVSESKYVTLYLKRSVHEVLRKLAVTLDTSVNKIIVQAIEEYLERADEYFDDVGTMKRKLEDLGLGPEE